MYSAKPHAFSTFMMSVKLAMLIRSLMPAAIPNTAPLLHRTSLLMSNTHEPHTDFSSEKAMLLSESRKAFIDWAVPNALPINCIQPTKSDEGDQNRRDPFLSYLEGEVECSSTSVVFLSEGFHNCKEMMSLHHRIVQHLTMHCGFRIVASETGLPESRDVANYITSFDEEYSLEEKDKLWTKGLNKMYSAWVEGRELVEWMKEYNSKLPSDEMISYCGLDIGGFYSDWKYPVSKVQCYLKQQLPDFEKVWSAKIDPILQIMGTTQARINYQHLLSPEQKASLVVLLDELVMEMNSHWDELAGDVDFEWAKQSAVSMQLAENYYRNYENMSMAASGTGISKYSGLDGREIAMANNLVWRLNLEERENVAARKMIVINHIIHTKTATQYQDPLWGHFTPMGQLVKQMLTFDKRKKKALFSIGMIYGSASFWNKWQKPHERFIDSSPSPKDDGLENVMKEISEKANMPNFFVHWDLAPKEAWMYLNEVTTIRENDYFIRACPLEWNGCIYLDKVSHATPA